MKISELEQATWRLNYIKRMDEMVRHIKTLDSDTGIPGFARREFGYYTPEANAVLPTPAVAKQIRDLLKADFANQRADLIKELADLGVRIDEDTTATA